MQLEEFSTMEIFSDIRVWLTILGLAGTIGSVLWFFTKTSAAIVAIEKKIEASRKSLSDEHTRHDENLIERISDIKYGLEKHISQEQVESAHQEKSREEVTEIRKEIQELRRK